MKEENEQRSFVCRKPLPGLSNVKQSTILLAWYHVQIGSWHNL